MGTFHKRNRLLAKELREANLANKNSNNTNDVNNNDQVSSDTSPKGRTALNESTGSTLLQQQREQQREQQQQQQQQPIVTTTTTKPTTIKSNEILIALVRKSILFTIFIGIISIKNNYYYIEHILLPNGNIDFTTPLLYNFLPSIKNNTLLQFQHNYTSIIIEDNNNTNNNTSSSNLLLDGPETIIINQYTDQLYIVNTNGYLVHVSTTNNTIQLNHSQKQQQQHYIVTATTTIVANLGNGRPLSGQFTYDIYTNTTTLYITDAIFGILRIRNFIHDYNTSTSSTNTNTNTTTPKLVVEIVISKDTYNQQSINFADDIIIESKSGIVYFTDATTIPPPRRSRRRRHHHHDKNNKNNINKQHKQYTWDLLYPTIQECLRNSGSGRLLQYNPITDITTVLQTNLSFANGISFIKNSNSNNDNDEDEEEISILIVETCRMQIHEYYLSGPKQGTSTIIVHMNQLPGFPDGIDCFNVDKDTTTTTTKCYIAIMNEVNIVQKLFQLLPSSIEPYIRILSLWATQYISLPIRPYGGLVEININTRTQQQENDDDTTTSTGSCNSNNNINNNRVSIERYIIDPIGRDITGITGVTYYKDKLYLGSLHNQYIGIYDLQSTSAST